MGHSSITGPHLLITLGWGEAGPLVPLRPIAGRVGESDNIEDTETLRGSLLVILATAGYEGSQDQDCYQKLFHSDEKCGD